MTQRAWACTAVPERLWRAVGEDLDNWPQQLDGEWDGLAQFGTDPQHAQRFARRWPQQVGFLPAVIMVARGRAWSPELDGTPDLGCPPEVEDEPPTPKIVTLSTDLAREGADELAQRIGEDPIAYFKRVAEQMRARDAARVQRTELVA